MPLFLVSQVLIHSLFPTQSRLLTTLRKKAFEDIVGNGENAGNQHFLHFPQCFLPFSIQISNFNPFPNKPWFIVSAVQPFENTMGNCS